jgi:hypothetical protein
MSGNEEQIEIDLGDTPKVEDQISESEIEIVDEEVDPKVEASGNKERAEDPEKALKTLQKKLEAERKAREEAERNARDAIEKAHQATVDAQDSRIHLVSGAIETLKRDDEILTAHLKQAMEIGDFDRAAEVQKAMLSNQNKMMELERGYEDMRRNPPPPPPPSQTPREVTVDDLINQVTPRSAEWLKKNKENIPDTRTIRIMARAHDDAVDYGIVPESDAYFNFIENRLGIGKTRQDYRSEEVDDAMSGASKAVKTRQSPPSAPVSRQPMDSPTRPGTIRLTKEEVEAAKISGISPQEYHRLKMQDRNRN